LQKEQLQCFSRNLSLAVIRELGRPGILTLDAATGAPSYALLTALGRDSATLRAAGTEQTVTLAALAARWQGDFATLWRTPPGYSGLASNPSGETVEWIATKLGGDGAAPPAPRREFDAQLRTRLRAFQLAHGLAADGQPGPMTFMQLNRAAGVEEPRLRTDL
jgi:general secretion pathway protein A